jgi:diacylglycerol kinase (ATP)
MKVAVVLNGISLEKKFFYHEVLPVLREICEVEVFETITRNDAVMLASKAVDRRTDLILSAGGDGTLFQVLNGVLTGRENHHDLPLLGIVPLGTGNDFGKTIQASQDINLLSQMLRNPTTRNLNVGKVQYTTAGGQTEMKYFLNVADVGMGPQVVQKVLKSGRPFGSAVAYYKSILSTFFTYKMVTLQATSADWTWRNKMRTFAIANGRYFGHGMCVAPTAEPDDDVFEVFACADASVLDFIIQSIPLKKGLRVEHPKVSYLRTIGVDLTAAEPCAIEADGEWLGWLPARVELAPIKVKFLVPEK